MSHHLQHDIERLKLKILAMGAQIEDNLAAAVRAFLQCDQEAANAIVAADRSIDLAELEVEEDCLKILALHQPVAIDLRYIIAILKIDNDLERIGDLASNIADRVQFVSKVEPGRIPMEISTMGTNVQTMLRRCLDALVNMDVHAAREVIAADGVVDDANRRMYGIVSSAIRNDPSQVDILIPVLTVSRFLERIADHTTNIAEDVIYMVDGEIVRHQESFSDAER